MNLTTRLANKPMVPTALTAPAANPLRPLRRHIGQPLDGLTTSPGHHAIYYPGFTQKGEIHAN